MNVRSCKRSGHSEPMNFGFRSQKRANTDSIGFPEAAIAPEVLELRISAATRKASVLSATTLIANWLGLKRELGNG